MTQSADQNPDSRRLVMGAAVGYGPREVRIFVESLRACGYRGDIVMFVGAGSRDLKAYLKSRGATPISVFHIRRIHGPIHSRRIPLFCDFLNKHADKYDEVLTSDVRDVAFQDHPFEGLSGGGCQFYLEAAPHTIGSDRHNSGFARTFLSPEEADALGPRRITCCGVVLGGTAAIRSYLNRIRALMAAIPARKRYKIGADTAFHGLLAYLQPAPDSVVVENNVRVATMGLEPHELYRLEPGPRVVYAPSGAAPPILHQYDRYDDIAAAFEQRFEASVKQA
ncbi:MAG: hypothetical protein ABW199_11300 [Caulobacterales bacterium]